MLGSLKAAVWIPLLDGLLWLLDFFFGFVGDYGVAIIMVTILMRLAMIPLTTKQARSTYEMQRIQPKIKEIQKKYKDDKQKQQEELMKFYSENKINPFGGCLPMMLQMPIFIALFTVLRNMEDPGGFWIILPDLSVSAGTVLSADGILAAVPYVIFVGLFGLSAWLPQKMMSQDSQQQKMGIYMALMMLYFGWISPGGVLVYWVTSSAWQVGQQAVMLRVMGREEG